MPERFALVRLHTLRAFVLPAVMLAGFATPLHAAVQAPAPVPAITEKDTIAEQEELLRLLKLSPKLTTVVAHDPSLLSDLEYVNRNNPQLGQFLALHPEIGRNPDYYLFSHLRGQDGSPDQVLERAVWPELVPRPQEHYVVDRLSGDLVPFLIFVCITSALIWLIRLFLENRRWTRIFKLQTEVHGKLIERFGSNQELLTYMGTEAGRRFLEAAPIPMGFDQGSEPAQRMPGAMTRVLLPLQIGIVLTLLGIGFLSLRHASPEMDVPMLVLGTVLSMPGLGFMISAGVTWLLAGRLGMMPARFDRAER
jgi:hypothetical protein